MAGKARWAGDALLDSPIVVALSPPDKRVPRSCPRELGQGIQLQLPLRLFHQLADRELSITFVNFDLQPLGVAAGV